MSTVISYKADSEYLKNDCLYMSLCKFYENNEHITDFLDILNGKSKISLRIIDWFVTNYAKKNNVIYYIPKKKRSHKKKISPRTQYTETAPFSLNKMEQFIVHLRYKSLLDGYQKIKFDPFCRNERIIEWGANKNITTTIGQLNFFRWVIESKILVYVTNHLTEIEKDMNGNIKKNKEEIENIKKSLKNQKISEYKSKKKRNELSKCATKTLHKHKVSITLDFN
jgi:hypothetical protein